jgi:hypothetical protein
MTFLVLRKRPVRGSYETLITVYRAFILPRREYSTHSRQVTAGEVGQEVV